MSGILSVSNVILAVSNGKYVSEDDLKKTVEIMNQIINTETGILTTIVEKNLFGDKTPGLENLLANVNESLNSPLDRVLIKGKNDVT